MSEPTFSTVGNRLVRLQLRGGSSPRRVQAVEVVHVSNFVPWPVERRVVAGVPLVTIEGTSSGRTWRHEIPERFLLSPRALHRALSGPMGPNGIVWVSQEGNLARWLRSELEALPAST